MQVIQAKNLSSGDAVLFPRVGIRRILRLAGKHGLAVSAIFDDGRKRTFPADKLVTIADYANQIVNAQEGELYRYDFDTKRTSVISRSAFHSGFPDVGDGFKALRRRVGEMDSSAALAEIERGSLLYTFAAIYWTPKYCRICSKETRQKDFIGGGRYLCDDCAGGMLEWLGFVEGGNECFQ